MPQITNSKIGFKRYPGFSLLFDNPGDHSLSPMGSSFEKIDCHVDDDYCLQLYSRLKDGLQAKALQELLSAHLFFPLPAFSYHVTVWDGLNVSNRGIADEYRAAFEDFLIGLPDTLHQSQFTQIPASSSIMTETGKVAFVFESLAVWGNSVLVAKLKRTDGSVEAFERLKEARVELYNAFENKFRHKEMSDENPHGWRRDYTPHVSLGYFGNKEAGAQAQSQVSEWTRMFRERVGDSVIRFNSISLYGFLDMETFFRK